MAFKFLSSNFVIFIENNTSLSDHEKKKTNLNNEIKKSNIA